MTFLTTLGCMQAEGQFGAFFVVCDAVDIMEDSKKIISYFVSKE